MQATQTNVATVAPATRKKRSILAKVLLVLLLAVAVLAAVIATRPADFRIERSATSTAPPAALFAQVNDFRKWDGWSPWARMDPTMKVTLGGPGAGVGATYHWVGNDQVGEGRMTILESVPGERIRIRLEFVKPFAATNEALFTFEPDGTTGTNVTWTMTGRNNFVAKAFHLFVDVDKMVGADFEKGLHQMKAMAEAPSPK
jgi:hypothetical protein